MANRYWVGGTATWNATAGTKWATTSGGAGGAAVPTSADDVFFDGASGANTVTIGAAYNAFAKTVTCTGFTGTLTGGLALDVFGNFTLVSGMTATNLDVGIQATGTVITAGKTLLNFSASASTGTVTLGDALTVSNTCFLLEGTFNTANFNITAGRFESSDPNLRTLTLGSSTVTVTGSGSTAVQINATNLTITANTATVSMTSASSKTFGGGGANFNGMTLNQGGAGTLTVGNSNMTFGNITNTYSATGATTITFNSGTTTTVSSFTASGAAGRLLTLNTTAASAATLSDTSGTNSVSWVNLSYNTATGGATWTATNSTDGGNNTGWTITAPPSSGFFMLFF